MDASPLERLLGEVGSFLADVSPNLLPAGEQPPLETLRWLTLEAQASSLAILSLIDNAALLNPCDTLLRSLLETYAHVQVIAGQESTLPGVRSPATRALCFELSVAKGRLGVAHAMRAMMKGLPHVPADELRQGSVDAFLQELAGALDVERPLVDNVEAFAGWYGDAFIRMQETEVERIRVLHKETGCKCRGRRTDSAEPVLRQRTHGTAAMRPLFWKFTSMTAHSLVAWDSASPDLAQVITCRRTLLAAVLVDTYADVLSMALRCTGEAVLADSVIARHDAMPIEEAFESVFLQGMSFGVP